MTRTHRFRRAATAVAALALTGIALAPVPALAIPALAADSDAGFGLPTDNAFLRAAHQANLTEIALNQDARKHASGTCVKDAAAVLERDHGRLDADVRALSDRLGVDLPIAPTAHQQQALADVMERKGTSGYDAAWLRTQDAAHRMTLRAIDHQIARGADREITAAARAARPVIAGHLEMVRGGKCRDVTPPSAIKAGNGGQAAGRVPGVSAAVALPGVAAGGAVVAGAAFWTATRLRRRDLR
ncbi:DUF4142 domain-containing protein [Streptomyces sp. MUM 203J]|uniref:DUF4142 domain-containing protein n=1 Tax=Streptomyces sp. MUM 203J TaxID=2791990 RepID=UPI001F04F25F|nr:DUF4142 domain-containing protein [Streptomyces sp. MUM 203J]